MPSPKRNNVFLKVYFSLFYLDVCVPFCGYVQVIQVALEPDAQDPLELTDGCELPGECWEMFASKENRKQSEHWCQLLYSLGSVTSVTRASILPSLK